MQTTTASYRGYRIELQDEGWFSISQAGKMIDTADSIEQGQAIVDGWHDAR